MSIGKTINDNIRYGLTKGIELCSETMMRPNAAGTFVRTLTVDNPLIEGTYYLAKKAGEYNFSITEKALEGTANIARGIMHIPYYALDNPITNNPIGRTALAVPLKTVALAGAWTFRGIDKARQVITQDSKKALDSVMLQPKVGKARDYDPVSIKNPRSFWVPRDKAFKAPQEYYLSNPFSWASDKYTNGQYSYIDKFFAFRALGVTDQRTNVVVTKTVKSFQSSLADLIQKYTDAYGKQDEQLKVQAKIEGLRSKVNKFIKYYENNKNISVTSSLNSIKQSIETIEEKIKATMDEKLREGQRDSSKQPSVLDVQAPPQLTPDKNEHTTKPIQKSASVHPAEEQKVESTQKGVSSVAQKSATHEKEPSVAASAASQQSFDGAAHRKSVILVGFKLFSEEKGSVSYGDKVNPNSYQSFEGFPEPEERASNLSELADLIAPLASSLKGSEVEANAPSEEKALSHAASLRRPTGVDPEEHKKTFEKAKTAAEGGWAKEVMEGRSSSNLEIG